MLIQRNQFWLLFQKNLLLAKRSKLWIFFELFLPCLFIIVAMVCKLRNTSTELFNPNVISGDKVDITRNVGFTKQVYTRWGDPRSVLIGYTGKNDTSDVEDLLKSFSEKFADGRVKISMRRFHSKETMIEELRKDISNINVTSPAFIGRYAGGLEFDEVSIAERKLSYRIHLPNLPSSEGDVFHIAANWEDPYGPIRNDFNRIPSSPPYWSSGFSTFQYALDGAFISLVGGDEIPQMYLHRLPEDHPAGTFVKFLPMLWGMCIFLVVIHSGREVAHEILTVKFFLSVMGLSSPMFYWSHVLFSWIKCMIIFLVCAVPLSMVMTNVSLSLFFFTVFLYGLGAVVFGVLLASMFKTPNSVIIVTIIAWIILIAIPYAITVRTEQISLCFLSSLNINGAFYFAVAAISDNMYRENYLGWTNMFYGGSYSFTIGYAIIMMIFDILWMSGLTILFDYVIGSSDFNLKGFFAREGVEEADVTENGHLEEEAVDTNLQPQIEMLNLVKIWSETGERAVDGISLNVYSGAVTVLLGHNGAGKSTTFSILCGLIKPSSGLVVVCNEEVTVDQSHSKIGVCPQGNALFDKLTVDEHLWLIHGLKNGLQHWIDDGSKLKDQLGLTEKSAELSMNLSDGMKRKLCVCLAFIGDSQVVLLDEPTAGMDPGAREDVERLLVEEKRSRTILLTTHYMDEAELFGDRVAIMCKGHITCIGSSEFLKKKFGTGYIVTIVVEEESKETFDRIILFAEKYIKNIKKGEVHGRQLEIILPKEEQSKFPEFLEQLELHQSALKITSFGFSLNTLEQVFLNVGEQANHDNVSCIDDNEDLSKRLITSQRDPRHHGVLLSLASVFTKRFLYSYRNWSQLATQVILPLLILVFITWLSNFAISFGGSDYTRLFSREEFGPSRVILQASGDSRIAGAYKDLIQTWSGSELIELSPNDNLTSRVITLPKTLPATGVGAYFGDEVHAFFNKRAPHAIVTSMNLISNARLKVFSNGSISTGIFAYSQPASSTLIFSSGIIDNLIGPLLILPLAMVTSTFVMFYVDERKAKSAHQQSLTGVSSILFWGTSMIYDLLFYTFVCGTFLVFFPVSKWMSRYLGLVILLWYLYFWAVMPFIYTVSFMFSSPSKANVLLVIWQIIAAFAAITLLDVAKMLLDQTEVKFVKTALLMFLPSFALGNGLMTLRSEIDFLEWDELGKNIVCMGIFGLLVVVLSGIIFMEMSLNEFLFRALVAIVLAAALLPFLIMLGPVFLNIFNYLLLTEFNVAGILTSIFLCSALLIMLGGTVFLYCIGYDEAVGNSSDCVN